MLKKKNGRYYIGPISYVLPSEMLYIDNNPDAPNTTYCFWVDDREHDFEIRTEVCYARENAKTYLELSLDDDEIEPLGEITPFSLKGLPGYYLDCYFPKLATVCREFYFDLPDKDYNFLSIIISAKHEKDLQYAVKSERIIKFFENLRMEQKARNQF